MSQKTFEDLSRRERQMMDVIYRLGRATAVEVRNNIPDPPTMNAVRRLLSILEEKGHVMHEWDGPRHVYKPVVSKNEASGSAIDHLKETFFEGSTAQAMAALLDRGAAHMNDEEFDALTELIEEARRQNR